MLLFFQSFFFFFGSFVCFLFCLFQINDIITEFPSWPQEGCSFALLWFLHALCICLLCRPLARSPYPDFFFLHLPSQYHFLLFFFFLFSRENKTSLGLKNILVGRSSSYFWPLPEDDWSKVVEMTEFQMTSMWT